MDISDLEAGVRKVTFAGRLDSPGVDWIEARFTAALVPGGRSAVVDLTRVDFVGSLGVRMFLTVARGLKRKGAGLALFGAGPLVRDVIEHVALPAVIPLCEDEAQAVAAVTP
jgi:anti-anti-sigma factor